MDRRRERAEATRRDILSAATELFTDKGYESTPIEQVLKRADVSRGALYHHFSSKEVLLQAVFENILQQVAERGVSLLATASDPLSALHIGCGAWLDATSDAAVRQIALTDAPAVLGWQRWREIDERYGLGMMKAALRAAMDAGEIDEQPVDALAHLLTAALGEAAMVIARADDHAQAREELGATFDRLLDGFTPSATTAREGTGGDVPREHR